MKTNQILEDLCNQVNTTNDTSDIEFYIIEKEIGTRNIHRDDGKKIWFCSKAIRLIEELYNLGYKSPITHYHTPIYKESKEIQNIIDEINRETVLELRRVSLEEIIIDNNFVSKEYVIPWESLQKIDSLKSHGCHINHIAVEESKRWHKIMSQPRELISNNIDYTTRNSPSNLKHPVGILLNWKPHENTYEFKEENGELIWSGTEKQIARIIKDHILLREEFDMAKEQLKELIAWKNMRQNNSIFEKRK